MRNNIIWEDFRFFLESLKSLSVSKVLTLSHNQCFCVSTNCSWESWVCYPDSITNPEDVERVVKFFRENNISFMWPLFSDDESSCKILEASGLVYAGKLEAMTLRPDKAIKTRVNPDVKFRLVDDSKLARVWADNAFKAFSEGDEEGTPENYYALVNSFVESENFMLYLAELDDKASGVFMITREEKLTGVYYFATLPELRRRGIAASMMNEICRLSGEKIITLQATPAGVPFYKSFGFDDLFAIKVYSTEANIF